MKKKEPCNFKRILRLYQADTLIRKYRFRPDEIIFDENGNLDREKDPKEKWAEKNSDFFPVEVNKSDFELLIRVRGIGFYTAKKIIEIRKGNKINSVKDLKKIVVRTKSFKYITICGKNVTEKERNEEKVEFMSTLFENI